MTFAVANILEKEQMNSKFNTYLTKSEIAE